MKIWTRLSPSTQVSDRSLPAERGPDGKLVLAGFRQVEAPPRGVLGRLRRVLERAPYTWLVLLPTLVAAIYYLGVASPQYVSESRFTVKSRQQQSGGLLAEALQSAGVRTASEESLAVRDHVLSLDALAALRTRIDLVEVWRRPEADVWARHWFEQPPAERLLDYYRGMVGAVLDASTGITTLTVRSFRATDSLEINRALLELGEQLVNRLNQRILDTTVGAARREVERAEERVAQASQAISEFRERERALDPSRTAAIAVETIGRLESTLAQTRTELQNLMAFSRPGNPQLQVLQNRIGALEAQIAEERRRTAGSGDGGLTTPIAAFERLRLEADFAGRALAAATGSLERAILEAQRQQVFLQRIVEPNLAERHRYPKRLQSIAYVFIGLSVIYGLGWLILAGAREHAS